MHSATQALGDPSNAIKKRSVSINGRRTSVSLEEPFWMSVRAAAMEHGVKLSTLLNHIEFSRGPNHLSSAIRVFAFLYASGAIPNAMWDSLHSRSR
ncbi:aryl-sulfate sulfotransferase [Pseudolabrys taiwanensis]|uniref:Aryl-sulfate sulfotransferase n=1 Tax=Pseudolabrys taiwanensis TaxID=331696 RepID=A0A345ZST2_9HYPH|nr:ribbon-helix-helix domain-containing protein [Pseudolabrys taiwanensis]AXK79979.1 aryl-sulfate sulfotransferase [Pseudolabrys taiwanensis]